MKFTEHKDFSVNMIKSYQPGLVVVNQQTIETSCIITQQEIIENWPVASFEQLQVEQLQSLLELQPEILLLGTGEIQQFPSLEITKICAEHGISIEAMNNAAACRTYNILTTEERRVVLGLIIS